MRVNWRRRHPVYVKRQAVENKIIKKYTKSKEYYQSGGVQASRYANESTSLAKGLSTSSSDDSSRNR
jgi:hypothetical protein